MPKIGAGKIKTEKINVIEKYKLSEKVEYCKKCIVSNLAIFKLWRFELKKYHSPHSCKRIGSPVHISSLTGVGLN